MKIFKKNFISVYSIIVIYLFIYSFPVSGAFETISFDARSFGMGEAFTAISDNNSALVFNPSGLVKINMKQLSGFYAKLFDGLDDGSNISDISLALSYPVANAGGISTGYFSRSLSTIYSESMISFGMGINLMENINAGLGLRYLTIGTDMPVSRTLVKNSASDLSMIFGLMYSDENFNVGISISEFNSPNLNLTKLDNVLKPVMRAGVAYKIGESLKGIKNKSFQKQEEEINETENKENEPVIEKKEEVKEKESVNEKMDFIVSFDYVKKDTENRLCLGAEGNIIDGLLSLRGGFVNTNKNSSSVTAGFGINIKGMSLDYGLNMPIKGLTGLLSHRISFTMRYGEKVENLVVKKSKKRKSSKRVWR